MQLEQDMGVENSMDIEEISTEEVHEGLRQAGTLVLSISDALIMGPDGEPMEPDEIPTRVRLVRSLSLQVVNTLSVILSVLNAEEIKMEMPDSPAEPFVNKAMGDMKVEENEDDHILASGVCPHKACEKKWAVVANEEGEVEPQTQCNHARAKAEVMSAVPEAIRSTE